MIGKSSDETRDSISEKVRKLVDTTDPLCLAKVSEVMILVDTYGIQKFYEGQCSALEQLTERMKPSAVLVKEAVDNS